MIPDVCNARHPICSSQMSMAEKLVVSRYINYQTLISLMTLGEAARPTTKRLADHRSMSSICACRL